MVAASHRSKRAVLKAAAAMMSASLACVSTFADTSATAGAQRRELTPADAIATVRTMDSQIALGKAIDRSITSPDGRRYVIRLVHGDIQRNGTWVDLLTGSLNSLAAASRPVLCAHLLTSGLGTNIDTQGSDYDAQPSNVLHWHNNRQVAFLWSDARKVHQVMSIDLTTCKSKFLTHSPTNVYSFGLGADGNLLFNAKVPRPTPISPNLWSRGFTVSDSSDAWSILGGDVSGTDVFDGSFNNEWFVQSASGAIHRVNIEGRLVDRTTHNLRDVAVDPTGRFAVTHVGLQSIPEEWNHYSDPSLQELLQTNKTMPNRVPLQYVVIDLRRRTTRTLWNAPEGLRSQVAWSPKSDAVLTAPTYLPPGAKEPAGSNGTAAAEVDVGTGEYKVLPIDLRARVMVSMTWLSASIVEIRSTDATGSGARAERFQKVDGAWAAAPSTDVSIDSQQERPLIQIEERQDLNHPPTFFAVDRATGESRLILETNPRLLERFKLGRVERLSGTLATGQQWLGQLTYPADYVAGKQYPLVIQSVYSRPWGREEYSLDGSWGFGMGLGPSAFPTYAGQMLATRNIAVLQLEVLHPSQGVKQAEDYQRAFETVTEQPPLSKLIDKNKIALDGFSRNGYWVEFTLAHSAFPFAAAIAADNYDPSYIQSALANWRTDDVQMNGATAFGAGLQQWLARAPGFNAEHIHTPLRMIGQSAGVSFIIAKWEIYSRLRHLHKPVEMYLMPDADRYPSHTPQNPRQIMAIQEGVIDWFSFWLTGREDPRPEKRTQYVRWHAFQASQAAADPQG